MVSLLGWSGSRTLLPDVDVHRVFGVDVAATAKSGAPTWTQELRPLVGGVTLRSDLMQPMLRLAGIALTWRRFTKKTRASPQISGSCGQKLRAANPKTMGRSPALLPTLESLHSIAQTRDHPRSWPCQPVTG